MTWAGVCGLGHVMPSVWGDILGFMYHSLQLGLQSAGCVRSQQPVVSCSERQSSDGTAGTKLQGELI